MPRLPMDLESVEERGAQNANGPGISGARYLEWQWISNFWSAVPRMPMDLESLERGAYNGNGPGIFGPRCLECQWT